MKLHQHAELEHPQDLPIGHLEAQLDDWVGSFPIASIRAHLKALEHQKGTIEAAIESLNRRLAIWQAMRAHEAGQGDLVPKPSKRDAVLGLLERDPHREVAHSEIRSRMIEDGLLEDSRKARHALEMTLSNMTKRGEVTRVRKGFYKLAPQQGARSVLPTNVQSRDGEVERPGEGPGNVAPDPSLSTERVATR